MALSNRSLEIWSGVFLFLAMLCAALAIFAGGNKAETGGPRVLARAGDGNVWLTIDQDLLIARPDGRLQQHVDLRPLKLPGPLNSLAALPEIDGQHRMLAGIIDAPYWLVLDAQGKSVDRITPRYARADYKETFHLAVSPQGQIAMATSGGHQVILFDERGKLLATSEPNLFRFANGIWFEDERWWVVDTNHFKIRSLEATTLKSVSDIPVPAIKSAAFPALAQRSPLGGVTTNVLTNGMEYGKVIELSARGDLLHQYPSQASPSQPVALLWLDDELLLAEREDFTVQKFNVSGQFTGYWGDKDVRDQLSTAYATRQHWSLIVLAAQVGAVLLGIIGIALYGITKRRREPLPQAIENSLGKLATPGLPTRNALLLTGVRLYWPWIVFFICLFGYKYWLAPIVARSSMPRELLARFGMGASLAPVAGLLVAMVSLGAIFVLGLWLINRYQRHLSDLPEFEVLLAHPAVRWLKNSPVIPGILEADEAVREVLMVQSSRLFPILNRQIWLLTNRRILIVSMTHRYDGKLLADLARYEVSASYEELRLEGGTFGRYGKLRVRDQQGHEFIGFVQSPVTARRIAALLSAGPNSDGTAPQRQGFRRSDKTAKHSPTRPLDRKSPSPWAAFCLSLLFPGSAQLLQGRFTLGLVLVIGAVVNLFVLIGPVWLSWRGHHFDMPDSLAFAAIAVYAAWAGLAAFDAMQFARRFERTASRT